jgi:putative ABC transport system permease protein
MGALWQDLKYGLGILRGNPLYAATAIISLAIGIAANTVFFTVFDTFYLRRLPVPQPDRLVQVRSANAFQTGMAWGGSSYSYSYPFYRDLEAQNLPFSGIFCRSNKQLNLRHGEMLERVQADLVSGDFRVLGVPPAIGRVLATEDEERVRNRPSAVLSYRYWMRSFGGSPEVLGTTIYVEKHPVTVVGVADRRFPGIDLEISTDLYLPVTMGSRYYMPDALETRRYIWLQIFGRLKPAMTVEAAQAPVLHAASVDPTRALRHE